MLCQPYKKKKEQDDGLGRALSKAECDKLGGSLCLRDCVLSGKRSEAEDDTKNWK
jgi:hypothetical protein